MPQTVDAHHHFWDTSRSDRDYYWMGDDLAAIRGRYGPDDLRPLIRDAGIDRTVIVQTIPSVPETEEFMATAAATDFMAGVVGWVDLTDPAVEEHLARLKGRPDGRYLVSIRHQVHDEADADWLSRPDVRRGIAAVGRAELAYDVLVRSRELPAALALVQAFPDMRFVVDHIAKPDIKAHQMEPWASRMQPLAAYPNVWVKVSGMVTEADWNAWTPDDLVPYVERLVEWFGPPRLLFGSDWPVCTLAASYGQVIEAARYALGSLSTDEQALVFGGNAMKAYRLETRLAK
jgi:L-fuconolactonase